MQLKCESIKLVLLFCVTLTSAAVAPSYRHFCPQCEEEVWEEVPCDQISKSTTTTTTTTTTASPIQVIAPTPTTPKPYATFDETALAYAHNITNGAAASYMPTTTPSTYNRCYCECKVGCKEFCRKVTVDGASDKQITQISKTAHRVPYGNIETEHVHQHRFVPDIEPAPYNAAIPPPAPAPAVTPIAQTHHVYPIEASNERTQSYAQPNLAYEVQPAPSLPAPLTAPTLAQPLSPQQPLSVPQSQAHAYPLTYPQHAPAIYDNSKDTYTYPDILMDASYSVDELTRLLQIESLNKDGPIAYSQPTLYTPTSSAAYSSMPTIQASHSQAPISASAPTYNAPSPAASPSASHSAAVAASNAEQKYGNSLSISHYEAANLGDPSAAQYGNYIDKHYESAPSSGENNEHQNSPSLDQHSAYNDNERRDCGSSDTAGTYHGHSASQSSAHTMSY